MQEWLDTRLSGRKGGGIEYAVVELLEENKLGPCKDTSMEVEV